MSSSPADRESYPAADASYGAEGRSGPERELIARIASFCEAPTDGVPFGDDLAELPTLEASGRVLATTDMLIDGVHFDSTRHSWREVGVKLMAVNLSDCAAMGCMPRGALLSVAMNRACTSADLVDVLTGLRDRGAHHGCPLIGGDTNATSGPAALSLTILAEPLPGFEPVRRDTAGGGEQILVTGPLGGSLLGRHLTPPDRLALAHELVRAQVPTAMIDISDGLALDLDRLARAADIGAELDRTALEALIHPDAAHRAAQSSRTALDHALSDGEDFELLLTANPNALAGAPAALRAQLHPLGHTTPHKGLWLRDADGRVAALEPAGYQHTLCSDTTQPVASTARRPPGSERLE